MATIANRVDMDMGRLIARCQVTAESSDEKALHLRIAHAELWVVKEGQEYRLGDLVNHD